MSFSRLFPELPAVIACIHLFPLPGSPQYRGNLSEVYDTALRELEIYQQAGVHGVIVENFRDKPFYPGQVPAETVATMSAVIRELVRATTIPVGVNVLRNDASAALAIAVATGARFVRINVHMGAVVADQGLLQGEAYHTLRMRARLYSDALIFADAGVKHAAPLVLRGLAAEVRDLEGRGMADAVIVSGEATGSEADLENVREVRNATTLPVLIGSGCTPENIGLVAGLAEGYIVGSYFKEGGIAEGVVDVERVREFMKVVRAG